MILQGINISPTICKSRKINIINAILHIYMIPYGTLESKKKNEYTFYNLESNVPNNAGLLMTGSHENAPVLFQKSMELHGSDVVIEAAESISF